LPDSCTAQFSLTFSKKQILQIFETEFYIIYLALNAMLLISEESQLLLPIINVAFEPGSKSTSDVK